MPATLTLPLLFAATFALQPGGHFHADEPVARDGQQWLALRAVDGNASLVATTVSVRPVFDALLDRPGQRSGREVSSTLDPVQVIAYVRGVGLREGAVDIAVVATPDPDAALPDYRLTWQGRPFTIATHCDTAAFVTHDDQPQHRCRIELRGDAGRQVLSTHNGYRESGTTQIGLGGDARLLFAGDIDRDGRLDLLFDTSDHYNVSRPVLYLSSQAGDGALVGEAARYLSVGC